MWCSQIWLVRCFPQVTLPFDPSQPTLIRTPDVRRWGISIECLCGFQLPTPCWICQPAVIGWSPGVLVLWVELWRRWPVFFHPQGKHAWQWKTTLKISIWVSLSCYFLLIAGRYKWVTRGYGWVMGGHGLCPSFAHGLRVHPLCIGFVWVSPNLALAWCLTIPSVFEDCSLITCRLVGGFKHFLCSI